MPPTPARKLAVVTCMDARLNVERLLGLDVGDAHVIRNAGALVTDDVLRSLSASQRLLETNQIVLVMHEDCGLHGASDDDYAQALVADGAKPRWRLGGFGDLDAALRAGLTLLRNSPELPFRDDIRGLVFDPGSGSLREVESPPG